MIFLFKANPEVYLLRLSKHYINTGTFPQAITFFLMDLIIKLDSYSFYHSNNALYASGIILEKKITDVSHTNFLQFQGIIPGQKLNFKYNKSDSLKIIQNLSKLVLKLKIIGIEQTQQKLNNNSIKFIFESAEKCDILEAK